MALEVRGKSIRITVSHRGETIRFTWPETANAASIARAQRAQDRIKRDLEDGAFRDLESYLPVGRSPTEFGAYAKTWLKSHEASEATRQEYRKALNRYWLHPLGDVQIATLRPSSLRSIIAACDFPSAKTKNNALIPLRQILRQAYQDELTPKDLGAFVKSEKHQKKPPDPFSRDEAEKIIEHFRDTHFGSYFEFMFYAGLRTGEGLALQWDSVDWGRGLVRIQTSQTKGRRLDTTKTSRVRDVLLNDRAASALRRQKASSFLAGKEVFVTQAGTPYVTEKAQRAAFTRALKKLGIRHRPQYNTRHTYATMLLMAGANPMFVAKQLGHSLQMLLNVYSTWISGDDDMRELEKLETKHGR